MIEETEFLDFLYVGSPRAGSTWLAAVLEEHPELWIPHNKEIHFFNDRLVYPFEYKYPRGLDHYGSYFRGAPRGLQLGELSPFYYGDPNAAFRISRHFPNVKILFFVRNPVEMLHSLYLLLRQREKRAPTFEAELERHPELVDLGFFHRLLTPYLDRFPAQQVFVREYDQFFADERQGLRELFQFLGVAEDFVPDALDLRINASSADAPRRMAQSRGRVIELLNARPLVPLKQLLHRLRINKMDYSGEPKAAAVKQSRRIDPETRAGLLEQFEPDVQRLEKELGFDLGRWRTGAR